MANSIKSSGCGCSSGASPGNCSGGDCGCGGGVTIAMDGAFKRPQFFAGQLLTEGDLQALTDYVVGKNRLRNRYLFGDGVVCGLSVTCHPCGGEMVSVAPGYALDCCGNDLLVPCKEDLDVKSLVRDLKQRQLAGYDCGDPCEQKDAGTRNYGLYLVYTETPDELVAPFSSSDPCGKQQCQPSRISEGYKFELRCDCKQDERTDVFKRILACVGDLKTAATAVAKAQANQVAAREMKRGLALASSDQKVPFTESSISTMKASEERLALFEQVEESAAEKDKEAFAPSELQVREKAADYQVLMGAMTRFKAQPAEKREALLKDNSKLAELIEKSEATLAVAGPRLVELSSEKVSDPSVKVRIEDNVKLAEIFAIGEASPESYETIEAKMVAYNAPVSVRASNRMRFDAGLLKSWLLERLEGSASQTRCDLYERTLAVKISRADADSAAVEQGAIRQDGNATEELIKIMLAYFVDCVCLALNPACNDCDDNAVLLACLKVEDCEVVDICNMSRRFVLSPSAMRYWLPPLGWIGSLFQKLCCGLDLGELLFREDNQQEETAAAAIAVPDQDFASVQSAIAASEAPAYKKMSVARTFVPSLEIGKIDGDAAMLLAKTRLPLADLAKAGEFSANLALVSSRVAIADLDTLSRDGALMFDKVSEGISPAIKNFAPGLVAADTAKSAETGAVISRGEMTEEIRVELSKEAELAREKLRKDMITELSKSVAKDVESSLKADLTKEVASSVKANVTSSVKTAVGKELTATKLRTAIGNVPSFKALSDDNRKLKAELRALNTKLTKLEGAKE